MTSAQQPRKRHRACGGTRWPRAALFSRGASCPLPGSPCKGCWRPTVPLTCGMCCYIQEKGISVPQRQ